MPAGRVGVIGGYGEVGRVVARELHARGVAPLRIGGRDADRGRRFVAGELDGVGETIAVDIADPATLTAFCAGCRVVVNCAGPSLMILDRVADAATRAGADYVDAAGDDLLYERLGARGLPPGSTALISAGMMPGLSGLLPRYLALQGFDRTTALTGYTGGRDRFTSTAATDYLASLAGGYGEPFAAWRGGARVARALSPMIDSEVPFFGGTVTAQPFLSTEAERIARLLGLTDARWYTVFDGPQVQTALSRLPARADLDTYLVAAQRLCRAAELDLFGRDPYQLFVLQLDGVADGQPLTRTLVFRGTGATELTGSMAAIAVVAVLRGEVEPGVHYAGEVLAPISYVERLHGSPAVIAVEVIDGGVDEPLPQEEGVL